MGKEKHPYTLREATPADRPHILPLLTELAPQLDSQQRWRWMYESNPEGQAITWVAVDDASQEIAGITSYFPIRLWVEGQIVRAALGGDGYVPPKFRRRGIAAALHRALRAEMPRMGVEVMFGAPAPMNRTPLQQAGSRIIGEMVRYVRPLAASALWKPAAPLDPLASVLLRGRAGRATLELATRGDARIDEVWAMTRDELQLATVRDARFYDWRVLDAPAQAQRLYVVVEDGRPIGVCVLQDLDDRLLIVDLCAPQRHWPAVLRAIAHQAQGKTGIELAILRDDADRRAIWKHGYLAREGRPYLAVAPEDTNKAEIYYDGTRWTYLDADIDVDHFVRDLEARQAR